MLWLYPPLGMLGEGEDHSRADAGDVPHADRAVFTSGQDDWQFRVKTDCGDVLWNVIRNGQKQQ